MLSRLVFVAAIVLATPALAQLKLLMFQQEGCPWCARWNADVAPGYLKSSEGQEAPLERLDIHDPLPPGLTIARMPQFTPTFVLVQDGKEVGRIEGYPGADFFWGLLDQMLAKVAPPPAVATPVTPESPSKT